MSDYVKGSKPQDLEGAVGGMVLDRHRNWAKNESDDMHPMGTGMLGPANAQEYGKSGKSSKLAKRAGDTKSGAKSFAC